MRGFLLLSVVGAVLYGLLLVTANDVPDRTTEDAGARSTQSNRPADRSLRSWGTNLPALVIQKPSVEPPRLVGQVAVGDPLSVSKRKAQVDAAKREHISTEPPSRTQTAIGLAGDELSKPRSTNPIVPSSKQRSRFAKPAPQLADKFIHRSQLQRGRWVRRDDRRRRSGLFGRRFATFDSSW